MDEPKVKLYHWIEGLSWLLTYSETLFTIDDMIADESLDQRKHPLLKLSISGRYRGHHLWLLIQFCSTIPKNLRKQAEAIFVWYPKERVDIKMIHNGNNVLTDNELVVVRDFLKNLKHACLYIYEMNIPVNLRW